MDMGAHLLTGLGGAKNPNDGYGGHILALRRPCRPAEDGIEVGRRSLIMIDAVQAEAEGVHGALRFLREEYCGK